MSAEPPAERHRYDPAAHRAHRRVRERLASSVDDSATWRRLRPLPELEIHYRPGSGSAVPEEDGAREDDGPRGEPDDYLLLQDALEMDLARVTEVNEGGRVPELLFANLGNLPVLAVQGEELRGAKQNRTLNVPFLGGPGKTVIPVTCVEMGRWAYQGPDEPLPGWPGPWGRRGSGRGGDEGR